MPNSENPSFNIFELEHCQSVWEQQVEINLTESGVHPISLKELIGEDSSLQESLLNLEINYPHVNGNPLLRERIAGLYKQANAENVLVTVGAAEANQIVIQTLLSPGDEMATVSPTYKQVWGIAENLGATVKPFHLDPKQGWALDIEDLNQQVNNKTKLIAVVNPNNPTGHIFSEIEMDAIVAAADRVGAWILADEVYRGAERQQEQETQSFFGRYDKVVAIGSMSKAYGLPGLRVGWVVGPANTVEDLWRRHEYSTISATMISNHLAAHALSSDVRPRLLKRSRDYIRNGYPILKKWMDSQSGVFHYTPPEASAVTFIGYDLKINSTELMLKLIKETGVFVAAGDSFGMDKHLRIAFGQERAVLEDAFSRIEGVLNKL